MLIQFKTKNFRSISNEQVIDLRPSREQRHKSNVFHADSTKALKAIGVYGANASGKSNLVKAFHAMEAIVRRSATKLNVGEPISQIEPFRLSAATIGEPSSFEVTVVIEQSTYVYGFSATHERVHGEWLAVKQPKKKTVNWLKRTFNPATNETTWNFSGPLARKQDSALLREKTRDNGLVLSRGAELNIEELKPLYLWFARNFWVLDLSIPPRGLAFATAQRAYDDNEFRKRVVDFLRNADVGISGLQISETGAAHRKETIPSDAPEEVRQFLESLNTLVENSTSTELSVKTEHAFWKDGKSETVTFDLETESNGTKRFFALANPILTALDDGDLLVVDELDCSMHPNLTRKIVGLFLSSEFNKNGAQLIFASHDSSLLDAKMFRRDQLWLTSKSEKGSTEFYSLEDIETPPRKNEAIERRYLEGRYGGVPNFGPDFDAVGVE